MGDVAVNYGRLPLFAQRRKQRQAGVSLIEALVSILILSFGLLGIAGLLLASAGQQKNSYGSIQGTLLIADITERMRANQADLRLNTAANPGDDYITANQLGSYAASVSRVPASPGCVAGTLCPPGVIARGDLNIWLGRVAAELPGGAAQIVRPAAAQTQVRQVVVMWNEKVTDQTADATSDARADTVNCPAAVRVGAPNTLRCISMVVEP